MESSQRQIMQDILEASVMGIASQGGPSYSHDVKACAYRGPHGRKCAIGQLIDDAYYSSEFNFDAVSDPFVLEAIESTMDIKIQSTSTLFGFLKRLQKTHDSSSYQYNPYYNAVTDEEFFIRWDKDLRVLCEEYKLRFPEELI